MNFALEGIKRKLIQVNQGLKIVPKSMKSAYSPLHMIPDKPFPTTGIVRAHINRVELAIASLVGRCGMAGKPNGIS